MLGIRYEQAEYIEQEMEKMVEQIKSIIQTLNANQVPLCIVSFCGNRMFSLISTAHCVQLNLCSKQGGDLALVESMTPIDVAVRILNNQLSSLMWLDEKVNTTNFSFIFLVCVLLLLSIDIFASSLFLLCKG